MRNLWTDIKQIHIKENKSQWRIGNVGGVEEYWLWEAHAKPPFFRTTTINSAGSCPYELVITVFADVSSIGGVRPSAGLVLIVKLRMFPSFFLLFWLNLLAR